MHLLVVVGVVVWCRIKGREREASRIDAKKNCVLDWLLAVYGHTRTEMARERTSKQGFGEGAGVYRGRKEVAEREGQKRQEAEKTSEKLTSPSHAFAFAFTHSMSGGTHDPLSSSFLFLRGVAICEHLITSALALSLSRALACWDCCCALHWLFLKKHVRTFLLTQRSTVPFLCSVLR